MTDLVIVSKHQKGFWQADLYLDAWEIPPDEFNQMGLAPDDFFTLKIGESRIAAVHRAREKWPNAKVSGYPIFGSAANSSGVRKSEGRCTCQDQHRRGYCTEPGCPYNSGDRK